MINPLKVATAGYLKRTTKAVLVIAVAGYLNFSGTPSNPNPPTCSPIGVGFSNGDYRNKDYRNRQEKLKKLRIEDDEILAIIKMWVTCQE